MTTNRPILLVERRGNLRLAIEHGDAPAPAQSGKRRPAALRLVGEQEGSFSCPPDRVLWRFRSAQGHGPRELREDLRRFRREAEQLGQEVDLELLCSSLDPQRAYGLTELVELYSGQLDDEACAQLFGALTGDVPLFHCDRGKLQLRPAEDVDRDRRRRDREDVNQRDDAAMVDWLDLHRPDRGPTSVEPPPGPPPEEPLMALRDWALRGNDQGPARGRRLAATMGLETPAEALALLEETGLVAASVNEVPLRWGFPLRHSATEQQEAAALLARPLPSASATVSDTATVLAIDSADTDEVDDALGVELLADGGLRVWVHISDVAASIVPDSSLDRAAQRRMTTVYFANGKLPMLPTELVAGRLSLSDAEERLAVSGVFEFGADFEPRGARFTTTRIQVDRHLTYDDTVALVDKDPEFTALHTLATKLRETRQAAGGLVTNLPYLLIEIDPDGQPRLQIEEPATPGHLVVSELMVHFNRHAAGLLQKQQVPCFYRGQPEALAWPAGLANDPLVTWKTLRLLHPATLTPHAQPHRTLGLEAYCRATSPIRRWPDLVVHRQLKALVEGAPPPYDAAAIEELIPLVIRGERQGKAMEAERRRFWVLKALEPRQGDTLDVVVSRHDKLRGRARCWVPELVQEYALDLPQESGTLPPPGTEGKARLSAVAARRGVLRLRWIDETAAGQEANA